MHACVYVCMHACMYAFMYVCMYAHNAYKNVERKTIGVAKLLITKIKLCFCQGLFHVFEVNFPHYVI
jgi:hypothetical protein